MIRKTAFTTLTLHCTSKFCHTRRAPRSDAPNLPPIQPVPRCPVNDCRHTLNTLSQQLSPCTPSKVLLPPTAISLIATAVAPYCHWTLVTDWGRSAQDRMVGHGHTGRWDRALPRQAGVAAAAHHSIVRCGSCGPAFSGTPWQGPGKGTGIGLRDTDHSLFYLLSPLWDS